MRLIKGLYTIGFLFLFCVYETLVLVATILPLVLTLSFLWICDKLDPIPSTQVRR